MCARCDEIEHAIARYNGLKGLINDHQMTEAADRLLTKLAAEKLALHPEN